MFVPYSKVISFQTVKNDSAWTVSLLETDQILMQQMLEKKPLFSHRWLSCFQREHFGGNTMTARTVSSFRAKLVQQNNKKLDIFMDRSADLQAIRSSKAAMIQVSLDKKNKAVCVVQASKQYGQHDSQSKLPYMAVLWTCYATHRIPNYNNLWYDTIRDAILTCARKATWVSLIYRTEPTTKKCKNRKKTK